MTPTDPDSVTVNRRARAQALFDAVLRTRAEVPDAVRVHCAAAVSLLGEPFPAIAAVRDLADDLVSAVDPAATDVEAVLRAALQELGHLAAGEFDQVFAAAEAGHDALLALR